MAGFARREDGHGQDGQGGPGPACSQASCFRGRGTEAGPAGGGLGSSTDDGQTHRTSTGPGTPALIRAIVFDLDGVLVDSEIWWDEARRDFAQVHGREWTADDRHAVMGANSRQWSETMRRRLDLDMTAEEIERAIVDRMVERYEREGAPAIDGAVTTVRRLATDWPLALASSSHPRVIEAALAGTKLHDSFRAIVSSDEVEHGKPAPDVFLEAARRLGVEPADILVVEDSLNGLKAGRSAGMATALVPNESIPPAPGSEAFADVVLRRITDIDPPGIERVLRNPGDRPDRSTGATTSQTRS
jgi:HAD superfamily hydrolase (TIGR01509 family)